MSFMASQQLNKQQSTAAAARPPTGQQNITRQQFKMRMKYSKSLSKSKNNKCNAENKKTK